MVVCVRLQKSDEGIVVVYQLRMDVGDGGFSGLPKSVGGGRKGLQVEAVVRRWKTLWRRWRFWLQLSTRIYRWRRELQVLGRGFRWRLVFVSTDLLTA